MNAIIWTLSDCLACEREKTLLQAEGYAIQEREAIRADGKNMLDVLDVEAFVYSENHGGKFPIVYINGVFSNGVAA